MVARYVRDGDWFLFFPADGTVDNDNILFFYLLLLFCLGLSQKRGQVICCRIYRVIFFRCFFAQLRTFSLNQPRIKIRTGILSVTGIVQDIQDYSDGRSRLILKNVHIDSLTDWQSPAKIWLNLSTEQKRPQINDTVKTEAFLFPPYSADSPTGFDFSRLLYFQQIGAIGSAQGDLQILKRSNGIAVRRLINQKIDHVMPTDTAGIAKALITGNTKNIPLNIIEHYRNAGIAHILSVSGLHMLCWRDLFLHLPERR